MKIAIAGAGSIGCFCGGLLTHAGHQVTLLGRPRILDPIRKHDLTVTDFSGMTRTLPASRLILSDNPLCLAQNDLIIVAVKSAATHEVAKLVADHSPETAPVLSWQNGLDNAQVLRAALPNRDVRAGMVPFNVVPRDTASYHRATSGDIVIQTGPGDLAQRLNSSDLPVTASDRIEAVQWGKLIINLNNALNALSGLTLVEQLMDSNWRRLMADQMAEALRVLSAAGHPIASTTPLPAWMTPYILRLPTPVFSRIAARMLTIDPSARTSMAYDLSAGRPTEINSLQGEIIRLGRVTGVATPICIRVSQLISEAPETPLTPAQITGGI
ncbi:MAG: 2-dehydropantoate 2-reductase [Pseudomonadota bacterium]